MKTVLGTIYNTYHTMSHSASRVFSGVAFSSRPLKRSVPVDSWKIQKSTMESARFRAESS